jgi:hypothetical protein
MSERLTAEESGQKLKAWINGYQDAVDLVKQNVDEGKIAPSLRAAVVEKLNARYQPVIVDMCERIVRSEWNV